MEWNENINIVWEVIASNGPVSFDNIVSKLGFEDIEIKKYLFNLNKMKLIKKNNNNEYELNDVISTLDWVKAVDFGIDISSLEKYVKLDISEKNEAIKIASDGTLEKHFQEEEESKKKDFRNYLEGKAMTEAAATDLAQRLEDSQVVLKEWQEKDKKGQLSIKEKMVYSLIILTNNELQKTYDSLIEKLIKKSER